MSINSPETQNMPDGAQSSFTVSGRSVKPVRPGIRRRITLFTISALLLMCITISLASYFIFHRYLEESLIRSSESSLKLVCDSIDSDFNGIRQMVRFCSTSPAIADYIEKSPNPGSVLAVSTHDRISEEYSNNPSSSYIQRLAVITNGHFLQIVSAANSSTANLAEGVPELPWFRQLLESPDYDFSTGFIRDPFYRNGAQVLPVIRPITYRFTSVQGGFLFMEITPELFTGSFGKYDIPEDSHIYLEMAGRYYRYTDGKLAEVAPWTVTGDLSSAASSADTVISKVIDCDGIDTVMVTIPLGMNGCSVSQSISLAQLHSQQRFMWIAVLCVLVSIIIIGILLMAIMNRMITVPVTRLKDRMEGIAGGDFSRDPSIEWNHELGDIGRGINDLAENVNLLMQHRLEDEKQRNDLEYKMLQSQINPHFIYNTLNSIKWMATVQGSTGISEMTTALSKLLKSLSKGTSILVPISEELSLLDDYFTIQSYRYGGTITMETTVEDESIRNCSIVKFTLQPLVENAIFHGIEPKGSGKISIRLYPEGDLIRIDVTDDGVGMSEAKAASLLNDSSLNSSDFFRQLGVNSVNRRLRFEFGEEADISIESREGFGTTMTVRIPRKEVFYV